MVPLTVSEDYEIIEDTPDLDPVTFDAWRVYITRSALDAWGGSPNGLRVKIRQALLRGGYQRTVAGGHVLDFGSHQMLLSADGRNCVSYTRLTPGPPAASGEPIEALREPQWDREAVKLTAHAIRRFTGRHRVGEDRAEEELSALLADAAARGRHHRAPNGNHWLTVDGFTLVLTPDGATVVSYRTVHAERTPSEVRSKVSSRFRGGGPSGNSDVNWRAQRDQWLSEVPPEDWLTLEEMPGFFNPEWVWITGAVVAHDADANVARDAVREALRQAVAEGQWMPGADGQHVLECNGRRWTMSPDGRGLLGCDPQWPQTEV